MKGSDGGVGRVKALGYVEGGLEDGDSVGRSGTFFIERSAGHPGRGSIFQQSPHRTAARGSEWGFQAGVTSQQTLEEAGRGDPQPGIGHRSACCDARRAGPFVTSQSAV